jgi:signal transduction histidine kinase
MTSIGSRLSARASLPAIGSGRRSDAAEIARLRREIDRLRAEALEARLEAVELREAVAARDAFLGAAGHELRNAMGSLLVATTNLRFRAAKHGNPPAWVAGRLDLIARQSRGFVRRATTILDVSRLSAGSLRLNLDVVAWNEIAAATVEELHPEAERVGCGLELIADRPVCGTWDRDAVEQITFNLVSNAVRYGAGRPVTVTLALEDGHGVLRVKDRGVGIPDPDRARIFEPFERAVRPGDQPGFGLGLWIVRQYARVHGGDIEVEAAPGAGSLFTVRLPGGSLESHHDERPTIPSQG